MGRTLLFDDDMEIEIYKYLKGLNYTSKELTAYAVRAATKSIIKRNHPQLAKKLTISWARSFKHRKKLVTKRGQYKKKKSNEISKKAISLKTNHMSNQIQAFCNQVARKVRIYNIQPNLVINIDQIKVSLYPGSRTMYETLVIGLTKDETMLPFMLVYSGLGKDCFPKFDFPNDWKITFSKTGTADLKTMIQYVEAIIIPYIKDFKKEQGQLANTYSTLLIMDHYSVHKSCKFEKLLDKAKIAYINVPVHCSNQVQPIDLQNYVAKFMKDYINTKAAEYIDNVRYTWKGNSKKLVQKLDICILKDKYAKWICEAFKKLARKKCKLE